MNSWPRQIQTTSRLVFPTVLPVVAVPRFGNQRGTDRYKFNPRNGEIT